MNPERNEGFVDFLVMIYDCRSRANILCKEGEQDFVFVFRKRTFLRDNPIRMERDAGGRSIAR